jgi:threonine/homoserine/homoserine lactone efflux protein
MAFLKGYLVGLAMVIFVGPVFFTLLKSTLQYGRLAGLLVALGIFVSDVVAVFIVYFGAHILLKDINYQFYVGIIGSVLLIILGVKYLFRPDTSFFEMLQIPSSHPLSFFTKGFLINFINPFVLAVWLGVVTYGSEKYGFTRSLVVFLTAALLAIFTTDTAKVFLAHRIKTLLKPLYLKRLYQAIGVCLIGFGIRMFWLVAVA